MDDSGAATSLTIHQQRMLHAAAAELAGDGRVCHLVDRLDARAGRDQPRGERDDETVVLVRLLGLVVACAGAVALLVDAVTAGRHSLVACGAALLVAVGATTVRLAGTARGGNHPGRPWPAVRVIR